MDRRSVAVFACCVAGVLAARPAVAAPVLVTGAVASPDALATFDELPAAPTDARGGLSVQATGSAGPQTITLGGTGDGATAVGTQARGLGLVDNGAWDAGKTVYAHVDQSAANGGSLTLTFDAGPVRAFSVFLNYGSYATYPDTMLTAYAANGQVLGTYDINQQAAIHTPGELNGGAYRGLSDVGNTIASVTFTGQYVVLDDVAFVRNTPEPGAMVLALVAAPLLLRRRAGGMG